MRFRLKRIVLVGDRGMITQARIDADLGPAGLPLDETANEFARDHTNVLKLFRVLDNDPMRQVAFYHPGLGTMEAVGALTSVSRRVTKVLGLAFGYGLERDVCDAYAFLMQQFEPDDTLFMFGFSRGAYTVRAVASLLHMYGLLPPGNEPLIPYATRMMNATKTRKRGRVRARRGLSCDLSRDRLQTAFRRRLGHRQFGRMGRKSPEAPLLS